MLTPVSAEESYKFLIVAAGQAIRSAEDLLNTQPARRREVETRSCRQLASPA